MEDLEKIENDYQDLIVEIEKLQREKDSFEIYIKKLNFLLNYYINMGYFDKGYGQKFARELSMDIDIDEIKKCDKRYHKKSNAKVYFFVSITALLLSIISINGTMVGLLIYLVYREIVRD